MHFTYISLRNWRNFAHVEVNLQRRVFLVGPNASGKSNFLDVFRFLHDLVSVGGGLEEAVGTARGGVSKLRCLAARRDPDIAIVVRVSSNGETHDWEYELIVKQDNRQRPTVKSEVVRHKGAEILRRPDAEDQADPERLRQTHLEQVNANRDFRNLADFFATVRYMHLVPQLVRDPRYVGMSGDPFGSDFLEQVARTPKKTQSARLRRINKALRVAVPQLQELQFFRDPVGGTPHLQGKYEHWRKRGAWQTEEQFSDGTLRLLGLLWAVLDGTGPLLLEEPELSLHANVVKYIPPMFARMQRRTGRQVMISTHSPDMLHDEGIGLDEVLLLRPGPNGTEIQPASSFEEIPRLLEGGATMAESVLPRTRPPHPEQLSLFEV